MSKHTDYLEKIILDIEMRILLTDDEDDQALLRDIYKRNMRILEHQRLWDIALEEPVGE